MHQSEIRSVMMNKIRKWGVICAVLISVIVSRGESEFTGDQESRYRVYQQGKLSVEFYPGTVNSVILRSGENCFAIYGLPLHSDNFRNIEAVALTHARREVINSKLLEWANQKVDQSGKTIRILAPESEKDHFTEPEKVWTAEWEDRYHNYAQQTSRLPVKQIPVTDWIIGQETIQWNGFIIQALETPGYTRGGVSYLITAPDGFRVTAVGDLIQGDGKIPDLYSFQDAIPEAGIRGYHGYAARLADLRQSLERIAELKPDVLIPSRGALVTQPQQAIQKLKERIQKLYLNYISTNALYWYFKAPHIEKCVERMLGSTVEYHSMPYSHYEVAPEWILNHGTSRILVSDSGHAFLVDCGYDNILETISTYQNQGVLKQVEGIFVTHYHDDHTDRVEAAREKFTAPVYCLEEYDEILRTPNAFKMPALTDQGIKVVTQLKDRTRMTWREYELTFYFFPGQALYHGALLVERSGEAPVLLVGDAFTPSGIDDYCLMNRNLMGDGKGYLYCLDLLDELGERFEKLFMLNQHVAQVFEWSEAQREYIRSQYTERRKIIEAMTPWPAADYAVDENWVRFHPYTQTVIGNQMLTSLKLLNHSPSRETYSLKWNLPEGLEFIEEPETKVELGPGEEGNVPLKIKTRTVGLSTHHLQVVTVDVVLEGNQPIRATAETMILFKN